MAWWCWPTTPTPSRVAWEAMALASRFFLVTANHRVPEIRQAGFLYLLIAHIGAIAILLSFGVLQANTGDYTFDNMRAQLLPPFWGRRPFSWRCWASGAKAGMLPLHVWLPGPTLRRPRRCPP